MAVERCVGVREGRSGLWDGVRGGRDGIDVEGGLEEGLREKRTR